MTAERTGLSRRGLERLRQRFVEEGFEATLAGKPRGHRPKSLGGADGARLVALACGPRPEGRTRWTPRLLAGKRETLAATETKTISRETVRRTLKKNELKPWRSQEWRIPPEGESGFVAAMEDILDVYTRKWDAKRPLVGMDEFPRQLTEEVRVPVPAIPGKPAQYDTEYKRNGVLRYSCLTLRLKAGEGLKQAGGGHRLTGRARSKNW